MSHGVTGRYLAPAIQKLAVLMQREPRAHHRNGTPKSVPGKMRHSRTAEEMDNHFEKRSLQCSPALSEALGPHQKHRQRIEKELSEFLSAQEARETATCVYNLAIEIDEEIDKILKDPLVRRLYEYDGKFFTPRGTWGFHVAFDGI